MRAVREPSRIPERWVRFGPGGRHAGFTACGLAGLALAVVWTAGLAAAAGRPPWLVPVLAGGMVSALLVVAAVEALRTGRPRLVCFHCEAAALLAAAAATGAAGQPVAASLDVAVPGLAVFLVCGRVGCLVAGCCHGRPAARGVRYGTRHVAEGLPPEYTGVPLLPVAAFEAAALAAMAVAATALVLTGAPPGTALAGYLLAHVAVRFHLEFLRGDDVRAQAFGLSEAQWTALAVTGAVGAATAAGVLPVPWQAFAAAALPTAAGAVVAVTHRRRLALRDAGHVREVARVVRGAAAAHGGLVSATTRAGVRVSASGPAGAQHLAFSRDRPALAVAEAALLARQAAAVEPGDRTAMYRSGNGVFHVTPAGRG
jgi:hypothetical protein